MPKVALRLTNGTKGSQSAKRLAEALSQAYGYKVWRTLRDQPKKKQLKYGQGVDKIAQYRWFDEQGLSALEWTTNRNEAFQWWQDGHVVFGRALLNSSCGKGIIVYDHPDDEFDHECNHQPVYTKYKKKKREFRVHVFKDQVVAVVEKKRRKDWDGQRESKIRNLANGYVFCSCESEPDGLRELALKASTVVQSDFRGVDIGFNEKLNDLFVIEVNSAPGIEGSNVSKYVQAIINHV